MHVIHWHVDRPKRSLVEAFRGMAAATVSDAMGRQNSMRNDMRPLWHGARLCGPAVTVKSDACDNLMPHKAMQIAQPGDVIVIEAKGHQNGALWGDLLSRSALTRGIEGVVMDAAARDRDSVAALGFPVFCTAVLPGGTYKSKPGSINVPISVAGTVVSPGDIIVGDGDGVVVIPRMVASEILTSAQELIAAEQELAERIEAGELIFDILGLQSLLSRSDVREVQVPAPSPESGEGA